LRFEGDPTDEYTRISNAYWNDSVLQSVIEPLKQYDMMTSAISSLIPKARQEVIYAKGAAKEATSREGQARMATRYAYAHRLASLWNVLVFDKDTEESQQRTFNFSGLDKIWEKSMKEVAGALGYPVSVLFGDEPAGLNATGNASLRNYYDNLASERSADLEPKHLTLLKWIVRDELGDVPKGFNVSYLPFWEPSAVEKATINKTNADADHVRIIDGVITAGRAMEELKENSTYRTASQEDVDLAKLAPPPVEEPQGLGAIEADEPTNPEGAGANQVAAQHQPAVD
jgi:phage-related protein (TIGR01555 family)